MTDIVDTAKSLVGTVTGFLGHHVTDLNNLASILGEVVGALPLDSQDKERIQEGISAVQSSADNITNFLENNTVTDPNAVTVRESDLVTAISNYFNSDAGKTALANAVKSNAS